MHPLVERVHEELARNHGDDNYRLAVLVSISVLHWFAANVDVRDAPPTVDRVRLASTLRRMAARIDERGGLL